MCAANTSGFAAPFLTHNVPHLRRVARASVLALYSIRVRCMRLLDGPPPDICKSSNTIEIVATLAKGILLSQEALIILLTCESSSDKRAKVVSSRMAVPWCSVFGVDHHSSLDCALKQARGLERPP